MIDESLSNWWASFKVNSGALSTRCWLSPLFLAFFKPSITFHLHQSAFLLFFTPSAAWSFSISPSLSSPVSISCALSHSVFLFSLLSVAPSSHLSPFFLASYGFITQITLSALTLCVSLSLSFPPLLSFLFLLSNSHSLTLSWCFSLRQLMENKITTIERGAFQDLKELERLWVMMCWRHCVNWILYKISLPDLKNSKNAHACRFILYIWIHRSTSVI